MIEFENILLLGLIPIAFIFLIIFINHSFIQGVKKRKIRIWILITRFLVMSLLIFALAAPYTSTTRIEKGDSTVNVLIDKSRSMDLFEDESNSLIEKLSILDGVNTIIIGEDYSSPIGNAILNNMLGGDNILLLSDGNSNRGKDLEDVMKFASLLNSTVNAINLDDKNNDASVSIQGPKLVLSELENTYYIKIEVSGKVNYEAILTLDGQEIKRISGSESTVDEFKMSFTSGYHKLEAKLVTNDFISENNIFYKSVNVLEKPKILLVSNSASPADKLFEEMYDLDKTNIIPPDLSKYFGIIINNMHAGELEKSTDKLTDFILDGNGIFIIGGKNSFELGNYDTSQLQTILPVKVGAAKIENITDLNIVMIIDISISSGLSAVGGTVVDIEKAQAVNLFNQLSPEDYLGVIAFNNEAHTINSLEKVKNQVSTPNKIYSLQDTGGTYLETALRSADEMLENAAGNKNVVVISDGKTKNPDSVLTLARDLRTKGIGVYTIGVGPGTDEAYMNSLAFAGGGNYFTASIADQISLMFGKERDETKKEWKLSVLNFNNFITKNIALNANVYGFNQVVPKSSAQMLVATDNGIPILSIWRFGLGRVAALSTDGGNFWAGQLLNEGNSKLISRTANWAVGDPRRKQSIRVNIEDGRLLENSEFKIYSESTPTIDDITLTEIDKNIFKGDFIPDKTGFFTIMGEEFAINYPREFEEVGINSQLEELVRISGGELLDINNPEKIIEKIRKDSEKVIEDREYYRFIILPLATLIFLIDIFIRRKHKKEREDKK